MKLCDHIQQNTNNVSKENNSAKLLTENAFLMSTKESKKISKLLSLSVKEYHLKHLSFYKKATEVISLLGNAVDHGYIDDDGSFLS